MDMCLCHCVVYVLPIRRYSCQMAVYARRKTDFFVAFSPYLSLESNNQFSYFSFFLSFNILVVLLLFHPDASAKHFYKHSCVTATKNDIVSQTISEEQTQIGNIWQFVSIEKKSKRHTDVINSKALWKGDQFSKSNYNQKSFNNLWSIVVVCVIIFHCIEWSNDSNTHDGMLCDGIVLNFV